MSDKRVELEAAAADAVQRSGFSNLSFRTLADQVGIKSSSVHYYFPGKSNLANAVIANYSDDFAERLHAIDQRESQPRAKLEAFVKLFESVAGEQKFCLCGMMAAEVDTLDEANRQALGRYFKQTEDWLTAVIEAGTGQLRLDMKPRVIARMLVSGLEGALLIDRVDNRKDRLRAQREFVRQIMT